MRRIFEELFGPHGPDLPPGTTSERLALRRAEGTIRLTRYGLPFGEASPDEYWANLFHHDTRYTITALVIHATLGDTGRLYWSMETDIPHRLRGNDPTHLTSVTLESTWYEDRGTRMPRRTVNITADGNIPSSGFDAGKLATILSDSGVDGGMKLTITSLHEKSPTGASQPLFVGTFDEFRTLQARGGQP